MAPILSSQSPGFDDTAICEEDIIEESSPVHTRGLTENSKVALDIHGREAMAKYLLAGGVAGAVSKTVTAPLARLTILYQVGRIQGGRLTLSQALSEIVRTQGFWSLWKGNAATILHRIPYSASNFYIYEYMNNALRPAFPQGPQDSMTKDDVVRRLLAGGISGSTACAFAYPLDLVRTLRAADVRGNTYKGIGSILQKIIREKGVMGLYSGLSATLLQVGPSLAINFSVYDTLRSRWVAMEGRTEPSVTCSLTCGSLAGFVSSTITFPLDVIRRRMQLMSGADGLKGGRFLSYVAVIRQIMQETGIRGFYAGLLVEYYKVIPGVAIAFGSYEAMKKLLGLTRGSRQ